MSASEKAASERLKALYESAYEGANGRTLDDKPLLRIWQRPHSEELIALANTLPQIVAVVEAAQRRADWCESCAGAGWDLARADGGHQKVACEECWPERRALAALEEALS